MEEPALFDAAHRLVLELVADGSTEGLRLDHIDGLWDPGSYLQRLRRAARGPDGRLPTIHVEKILAKMSTCAATGRSRAPPATR